MVILLKYQDAQHIKNSIDTKQATTDDTTYAQDIELCLGVSCPLNSVCQAGNCICDQDYKVCGSSCIPDASCCTDSDCSDDKVCKLGFCTIKEPTDDTTDETNSGSDKDSSADDSDEKPLTCVSNKEKDKDGDCVCRKATRWCDVQDKCIPISACCGHSDCSGDDYCQPFISSVNFCLKSNIDDKKSCRRIAEAKSTYMELSGYGFNIEVADALYKENVDLRLNSILYEDIVSGEMIPFNDDLEIYVDDISLHGGKCVDLNN